MLTQLLALTRNTRFDIPIRCGDHSLITLNSKLCVASIVHKKYAEHVISILKRQIRTFQSCTFKSTRPAVTYCVYEQAARVSGIQRVVPQRTP